MQDTTRTTPASTKLLKGILPINRAAALRDALAGISLASMDIPQVLGYARIAGMPAVTGLYTAFLPLFAFALFGASRHLVVAADSATATIFASRLSSMAAAGSPEYVALAGMVALLLWSLLSAVAVLFGGAVGAQLEAVRAGNHKPQDAEKVDHSEPDADDASRRAPVGASS